MYKIKTDKLPQSEAIAVEIVSAELVQGPKINKYPNFTESIHLILALATVAFWEITRKKCSDMKTISECVEQECSASARDGALTLYMAIAGFYVVDYYSGFDQKPGDPNERCLYIPRFIIYICTGVLYIVRNEARYGCKEWDVVFGILSLLYCVLSIKHFWLSIFNGIVIARPPPSNPYPKEERVRRKKFRKGQSRYVVPVGNPKSKV